MPPENPQRNIVIKRISYALIALTVSFFGAMHISSFTKLLALSEKHINVYTISLEWILFLFLGFNIISRTQKSLTHKKTHTDLFLVVGSISAMTWSTYAYLVGGEFYVPYAFAPIFFFYVGDLIKTRREAQERESTESLLPRHEEYAYRITSNGSTEKINVLELAYGDACLIKPNATIPTDGIILFGETEVDESPVTNNPFPIEKEKGDALLGGTVNGRGSVVMSVTVRYLASKMNALRAQCLMIQKNKTSIDILPEGTSRILLSIAISEIIGITFLHLLISDDLSESIRLFCVALFTTLPWTLPLVLPMTASMLSAVAKRKHIRITNDHCFSRGKNIDTVVFGKTGILTKGFVSITDTIENHEPSMRSPDFLRVAGLLARHSHHPLSSAIIEYAKHQQIEPITSADHLETFTIIPEKGIYAPFQGSRIAMGDKDLMRDLSVLIPSDIEKEALDLTHQGSIHTYISKDDVFLGVIAGQDAIRPEAKETIRELRAQGIDVHVMTGDSAERAFSLSTLFDIHPVSIHAGASPEEKRNIILSLQKEGRRVAFVGNLEGDVLALATADLRIVTGKGSDLTMKTADVTIIQKPLTRIPDIVNFFSSSQKILNRNYILSYLLPVISAPLVIFHLIPNAWITAIVLAPVVTIFLLTKNEQIRQRKSH